MSCYHVEYMKGGWHWGCGESEEEADETAHRILGAKTNTDILWGGSKIRMNGTSRSKRRAVRAAKRSIRKHERFQKKKRSTVKGTYSKLDPNEVKN